MVGDARARVRIETREGKRQLDQLKAKSDQTFDAMKAKADTATKGTVSGLDRISTANKTLAQKMGATTSALNAGIPVMAAMGGEATKMAASFGAVLTPLGPLGTFAGLAAAGVGLLIDTFRDAEEPVEKASDSLERFGVTLDDIQSRGVAGVVQLRNLLTGLAESMETPGGESVIQSATTGMLRRPGSREGQEVAARRREFSLGLARTLQDQFPSLVDSEEEIRAIGEAMRDTGADVGVLTDELTRFREEAEALDRAASMFAGLDRMDALTEQFGDFRDAQVLALDSTSDLERELGKLEREFDPLIQKLERAGLVMEALELRGLLGQRRGEARARHAPPDIGDGRQGENDFLLGLVQEQADRGEFGAVALGRRPTSVGPGELESERLQQEKADRDARLDNISLTPIGHLAGDASESLQFGLEDAIFDGFRDGFRNAESIIDGFVADLQRDLSRAVAGALLETAGLDSGSIAGGIQSLFGQSGGNAG